MDDWTSAEERAEQARRLYEEGRWAEAAAELRAAIDVNPYNPAWHFNLALALDAMEQYRRAAQAYEAVLELQPDDVETLNCLAVNLTRQGRCAEALRRFEHINRIDPDYEPAYCNRIITYTEMGDHEGAELMFHMARQVVAECPLCYYNLGGSYYARGMYRRAIECWRRTLKLSRSHAGAHARIADACWALGDLRGARRHYQAELRLDDRDVETLLDLGEVLMELGELDQAGAKFRRALEVVPDHAGSHYCLGELALAQNRPDVAEEQFHLVLRLDPSFPGAHARLGQILARGGRRRKAAHHLLAELRVSGDDPEMLQEVGQLLIEVRKTHQANTVLRRLVRLLPQDPQAHHNLAVSFFLLSRLDDGIRHCRRALNLRPGYPLALYNLALAHLQKGSLRRARRYAARALTAAPNDERIRQLSRRINRLGFWSRLRMRLNSRAGGPPAVH